jgi:RNA polymerase sigma-70 factor (ECF subfamily)
MVLPHLDDAYRLARWLTGSRADAEDVAQEACLKALAAMDTAQIEQPRAWLLTIVRNTALTWLKKNRSKSLVFTEETEALESGAARAEDGASNPEEALIAAADEAALEAAIDNLPHLFREVVVMRDINGLSYRDIAAAIDAPVGTVMSRLSRGRATLIEKLGAKR